MGYVQKTQILSVEMSKHLDTNLRFYLILKQLKLFISGNNYIQLPYVYMFTVVQVFSFENFQYNH